MKLRMTCAAFLFWLVISLPGVARAAQAPAAAPAQAGQTTADGAAPKIDPAKEADIRKLMALINSGSVGVQMMNSLEDSLRPLMVNALPPGAYRDQLVDLFIQKFRAKADEQALVDMMVRLYDKYYSADEIKGLLEFYSTPLGQKMAEAMPKLAAEAQQQGGQWGQQLAQEAMIEVLTEHPDLAKAVQDAQSNRRSQ